MEIFPLDASQRQLEVATELAVQSPHQHTVWHWFEWVGDFVVRCLFLLRYMWSVLPGLKEYSSVGHNE